MTLENIKSATAGIADKVNTENSKLLQETTTLVQNMPGGFSGLVKQFRDKGLGSVASSWTSKGITQSITADQIIQGFGSERISTLATASGIDVKLVPGLLVTVLPKVVQLLAPTEKVLEVVAPAPKVVVTS
jgi:uncharacterized protein YidB (DUF937 family)